MANDTVKLATATASVLSLFAIVVCMLGAPAIYSEVTAIWRDLDREMAAFNRETNDIWKDIVVMVPPRTKRQYGGKCNPE